MPRELWLALQCRKWNTLPEPGGLLDQPYELMQEINTALNTYDTIRLYQQLDRQGVSHVDMATKYPDVSRFIFWLQELQEDDQQEA